MLRGMDQHAGIQMYKWEIIYSEAVQIVFKYSFKHIIVYS